MELKRVVGQFGTGQFGTKIVKTDNLAPRRQTGTKIKKNKQFGNNIVKYGQFGSNISKRSIWHRNFWDNFHRQILESFYLSSTFKKSSKK